MTPMKPRQKKLIIALGVVPFLVVYAGLCVWISDYLPDHWLVRLIYYIFVGTVWAFPLKPVMKWMNHDPDYPAV
ncbi:DUF2842 domain-containing protein [Parvularcula sp. LCG005]|uniref:DUF2842 domain-containing protein n=1 Tax=Parvularcula sp. LCG005 TaxID=3078805 RepID=UPI002942B85B|nr:DUF2842 domain-containing protein [Parvularcula sp. LCG005]WOI52471.1 DUF2842 domain-containing protein [Parvularcula sp. LCG005]